VKHFDVPEHSLGSLDAKAAAALIAASSDIALVIDNDGVIRDLAFGSEDLALEDCAKWLGQPWTEVVTVESRPKVEALLRGAAANAVPSWRHVNHPSSRGTDVPLLYSAIRVGTKDHVVAVGRDLRGVAALQQRLLDAQQSLERDYWRLRHAETRYRHLFQMVPEAILIVDASSYKVLEANPVASQLFGMSAVRPGVRSFPDGFDAEGTEAVQSMLTGVRVAGSGNSVRARSADGAREFLVSASLFRQENSSLFLVRVSTPRQETELAETPAKRVKSMLSDVVERMPDSFVVTDPQGVILAANSAFIEIVELAAEEQVRGQSLGRWLGRSEVDMNVLIANLRQHGTVRLFATALRGELGASEDVEISAVAVAHGPQPCLGFTIRNVGRRLNANARAGRELPRSVEQLTELVGLVPLKDLVQESTDLIEKLCIEAALELTRDNRASAAEMLGLSRQSLYVKLRRYGLGDLNQEPER
jgi:transcriptional regulator PpsR